PSAFLAQPSLTVTDYINQAGGFTPYADKKTVLVVKADGSVWTRDGYDNAKPRTFPMLPLISGGLMDAQLEPGDTIYIPIDLTGIQNLEVAKSITQIIANSAMTLGVIGLLATKL